MEQMEIPWTGPYGMPTYEGSLPPLPAHPGIYLFTVESNTGYLVCSPGLTQRPIRQRMSEHVQNFLKGNYNILDVDALRRSQRVEVWHGWSWSEEKRTEYARRHAEILAATERQLSAYRIFVTDATDKKRLLERIEASIMQALYALPSPHKDILDENMHFAGRRDDEEPILAIHRCHAVLHGIPNQVVM